MTVTVTVTVLTLAGEASTKTSAMTAPRLPPFFTGVAAWRTEMRTKMIMVMDD